MTCFEAGETLGVGVGDVLPAERTPVGEPSPQAATDRTTSPIAARCNPRVTDESCHADVINSAGYSRRDASGRRASRRTYRSADSPVDGVVLHEMGLQPQRHL